MTETVLPDELLEGEVAASLEPRLTAIVDRWYHTHDSRHSPSGFPDYSVVLGPWLIFAELKKAGGSPTAAQAGWLKDLRGPWRLCLLVGGMAGADQLVQLVERMKSGGLPPFEVSAAASAVQVLGAISPRGRLAVADGVTGDDVSGSEAAAPRTPRRRTRGTR